MAEKALGEINVLELELIQGIQTAVKAFEARNPTQKVNALTYQFTSGGSIKYDVDLQTVGSGTVNPTGPQ